jgi:hypothetical protein
MFYHLLAHLAQRWGIVISLCLSSVNFVHLKCDPEMWTFSNFLWFLFQHLVRSNMLSYWLLFQIFLLRNHLCEGIITWTVIILFLTLFSAPMGRMKFIEMDGPQQKNSKFNWYQSWIFFSYYGEIYFAQKGIWYKLLHEN